MKSNKKKKKPYQLNKTCKKFNNKNNDHNMYIK